MNTNKAKYFHTWVKQSSAIELPIKELNGERILLANGDELVDTTSSSYQVSFGHSHDKIISAIKDQLEHFSSLSPKFSFSLKNTVSENLVKLVGIEGRIFYTVSGAESVENAIKISRDISQKKTIVARPRSYHGATQGALSVTGDWRNQAVYSPQEHVLRIPDSVTDQDGTKAIKIMKEYGVSNISALCIETIPGNNGVLVPSKDYLKTLEKFCKANSIHIILDEVICGFYRCHSAFAFQEFDLEPDFVCMAKAITGGHIPFGALWVKEQLAKVYDQKVFPCGLTNYAHPLGLAACQAVLNIIKEEEFKKNLSDLEKSFKSHLQKLNKLTCVNEVRSIGLLGVIECKENLNFQNLLKHKLYGIINGNLLLLAPNLNLSLSSLKKMFSRIILFLEEENEK